MLTSDVIQEAVERAFVEDAPWGDLTSEAMFGAHERARARIVARQSGVMCGADVISSAFRLLNADARVTIEVEDGESFASGQSVSIVETDVRSLLRGERVALNFIQRMSGISTLTKSFVDAVAHTKARIVDTRKTTPGLRIFEKYAVKCGGGVNHRFSLSDAVLVKDNHLAHLASKGVAVDDSLRRVRNSVPFTTHIEVEVDSLDQIPSVLESEVVDSILIDNFDLDDTRKALELVDGRVLVNASGGISSPEQAREVAEAGVDLISIGALTHSARVIDFGLDMSFL